MFSIKVNHISSFQIFQVLKYSGQVLINIALAKTSLSTEELGLFELFLFITSSVSFFWVTGIMQSLLSIYPNLTKRDDSSLFVSSTILIFLFSVIALLLVVLILNSGDTSLDFNQKNLLLLFLLINPIGFLAEYILLLKKKLKELVVFGIITFIVPSLFISAPPFLGLTLNFSFYGLLIWSALKLSYTIKLVSQNSISTINKKEIKQLLINALPLIGTALLVGSATYIDGYIITTRYDEETFAIFRYGAKEFPLFLIIASSFSNSMIPLIAEKGNLPNALTKIKDNSRKMMHWFFPLAVVFLLTSHHLFPLVFNPNFSESYKIFDIYLLLIISRFVFPQSILMGLKKHKTIFLVSISELIINIIASLILIKHFGYIGVAHGTVIAYFFEKIVIILTLKNTLNVQLKEYLSTKTLVIYSLFLLAIYILKLMFF